MDLFLIIKFEFELYLSLKSNTFESNDKNLVASTEKEEFDDTIDYIEEVKRRMSNIKRDREKIRKENREGSSIREKRMVKRVAWKLEYIKLC